MVMRTGVLLKGGGEWLKFRAGLTFRFPESRTGFYLLYFYTVHEARGTAPYYSTALRRSWWCWRDCPWGGAWDSKVSRCSATTFGIFLVSLLRPASWR